MRDNSSDTRKLKRPNTAWIQPLRDGGGSRYQQIADQILQAVKDGVLLPGDRLPPQRELAQAMSVDLTTVTRAYSEVRQSGLLDAHGAGGTYIADRLDDPDKTIDLGMNIPPLLGGHVFTRLMQTGLAHLQAARSYEKLMSYHVGAGSRADREAGTAWLEPALGRISADRIVVCAGAQAALSALVLAYSQAGDAIAVEALTYPGVLAACRVLQRSVQPVSADEEGMVPDDLDRVCRIRRPALIYLVPTIQNPTATTMSAARRRAIHAVACRHGVPIIEDDPYWLVAGDAPPPLAALNEEAGSAPVFYVSTLSKCLAPGLRTAYLVIPHSEPMGPVLDALRATTLMGARSMSSLATHWIGNGSAQDMLQRIRLELAQRQKLAAELLPEGMRAHPCGLHVWLPLPDGLDQYRLIQTASEQGLGVADSDAFSADDAATRAIRISLGGASDQASLKAALNKLTAILVSKASVRQRAFVV